MTTRATQISEHGRNRDDMRKDAKNLMNRLKSIKADSEFVDEIANLFPQFPVIANERCGTWYVHPSKIHKPGVYFKSTDGHTGRWDFNLRRYNPHLISIIIKNGGCIIVDSTRKGKRVPDALSKTIPIWCATINNAVQKCAIQYQEKLRSPPSATDRDVSKELSYDSELTLLAPCLDNERWDTRFHSLPSLISRSEHAQIAEKIEGFAEKLMRFTDLTPLTSNLLKPIRPIWITPQSFFFQNDMPDYSQVGFFPVICLSASRVVPEGMEECDGYLYVQGSGDDEEMWSKGLTPELFWENEQYLLEEAISSAECEKRAHEVVQEAKKNQLEKSQHQHGKKAKNSGGGQLDIDRPLFTPSMELCSEIKSTPIWIGNNQSGRLPDCWLDGFDMVINCAAEIQRPQAFEWTEGSEQTLQLGGVGVGGAQASLCVVQHHQLLDVNPLANTTNFDIQSGSPCVSSSKEYRYLHLPIAEGKKGQHQLLEMIPIAIKAVRSLYTTKTEKGQEDGERNSSDFKILVHCQQGMDRSVGIALAILVSSFDMETGRYLESIESSPFATKETIQKRLFQIMSHRLAARPSRATLKIVNTYFMSPVDPPPAKYKKNVK